MFPKLLSNRFRPRLYCPDGKGFWSGHLPLAADLVDALKPSLFVELGAYYGESYFGFCQAIQECGLNCPAYAVDNWSGDLHTGPYGPAVFETVSAHNAEHYSAFSSLLRMTFDEASTLFANGSIDLLHMDGCHTYAAVKHDFETWLPKVSAGGIVVIHDIAVRQNDFEVWRFWEEISERFPSFAFQHSCGLGVLANRSQRQFEDAFLADLLGGASDPEAVREHYVLCADRLRYAHQTAARPMTTCQIFWAGGGGYAEDRSVSRSVPLGEWTTLDFNLPCAEGRLRLDPSNCPGVVEISSIAVQCPSAGRVLWRFDSGSETSDVSCFGTAARIPDESRFLIFSYGEDPQVHLPALIDPPPGQALRFSCRLRIDQDLQGLEAAQSAGRAGTSASPAAARETVLELPADVTAIRQKIAPLKLAVSQQEKRRVNLIIPTVDFNYVFGGYIAKLNLARRLAEMGFCVRILIVDYCDYQPALWKRMLRGFAGLEQVLDSCEWSYVFDRSAPIGVNPGDSFIATTWWTAHIARQASRELSQPGFLYLIQEYEPFTFPMGTYASLARETYGWDHYALFSTDFLRDYFRRERLGVFAAGDEQGELRSAAFQNAITKVDSVTRSALQRRTKKKLLFYARPETHAARNMFELGLLALCTAVQDRIFDERWEFTGIGSVEASWETPLGQGRHLKILRRQSQAQYQQVLEGHDLGLSLMYTPHPSLVPIEMASAGMVVLTNTFSNKTAEALRLVSPNLIGVEPTLEGVVSGLKAAVQRVGQFDERVAGARVNWSTDWNQSFDDVLMQRVAGFLRELSAGAP